MLLTAKQATDLAQRLYGCSVRPASPAYLRACWEHSHPKHAQARPLAPAHRLVAVGWRDATGADVYVHHRWAKHADEQVGSTLLALAAWLAALPLGPAGTHLCALQRDDGDVVVVQQQPRPRLLPLVPPLKTQ